MELRHIRYFAAIAREGNISRAAKRLGLSQPALSKQLGELEDELGQPLLTRGARAVKLTAKGMVFRQRADEILSLVDRTAREVSCAASKLSGRITLGAAETFGFAHVAAALAELQRKNPAVSFHLVSGNAEDLAGRVQKGELDLALLLGPGRLDGCETLPLNVCHELGLVLRRDDPLARKKSATPGASMSSARSTFSTTPRTRSPRASARPSPSTGSSRRCWRSGSRSVRSRPPSTAKPISRGGRASRSRPPPPNSSASCAGA